MFEWSQLTPSRRSSAGRPWSHLRERLVVVEVVAGGTVEGPPESSAARLLGPGAAALGWTTLAVGGGTIYLRIYEPDVVQLLLMFVIVRLT